MFHAFTFLTVIIAKIILFGSTNPFQCTINISTEMKTIGNYNRLSKGLIHCGFKAMTHIHDNHLFLTAMFSYILLDSLLLSIFQNFMWSSFDWIYNNGLIGLSISVTLVFINRNIRR